jgi:hypothetical protein
MAILTLAFSRGSRVICGGIQACSEVQAIDCYSHTCMNKQPTKGLSSLRPHVRSITRTRIDSGMVPVAVLHD